MGPQIIGVDNYDRTFGFVPKVMAHVTRSNAPVPLFGGLDVLAYRIVEEVLDAAGEMAPSAAVSLRFSENSFCLDFVLARPLVHWAHLDTRAKVQRFGGSVRRADVGAGEQITVELPLASALVSQ